MQYVYLNYHVLACADSNSCEVCDSREGTQTFTSSDYTCLINDKKHKFCNQHKQSIRCPVHRGAGCKRCEVHDCLNEATKKFSHADYTCLNAGNHHYFGDKHRKLKNCPIHRDGKRKCEIQNCSREAKRYSRAQYPSLPEHEYYFFCETHAT